MQKHCIHKKVLQNHLKMNKSTFVYFQIKAREREKEKVKSKLGITKIKIYLKYISNTYELQCGL